MGGRADAELAELDPDELRAQLSARLTTLPPDAYLRCVAAFVAEYQRLYHVSGLSEALNRIVDAIVALAARAAAGIPVHDAANALDREFTELTYPGLEDDDAIQPYDGPLPMGVYKACGAVLWELTDEAHRYDCAGDITDGAAGYEDPHDRLAATRLLLRFLDRADREAAGEASAGAGDIGEERTTAYRSMDEHRGAFGALRSMVTGPLTVRRARTDDLHVVLELLDRTAAWQHSQGIPEWLTWPDRHDTVAASIGRGEVWLLSTATGDVAATATLSTADPGPGLWDESDRRVAATHLSRLAVRPDFLGQGVGAQLLDWARARAYRDGSFFLRIAAWPHLPNLHAYLRRQGFRELWTVAGPPTTSRTLFVRHAAPDGTVVRIIKDPTPTLLATQRVEFEPGDARPAQGPEPDHAHVARQLLSEHGTPIRIVPGYRYRLRDTDDGWRIEAAKYVGWQPGNRIATADGLAIDHDRDYVLTHHEGSPCGVEIVSVQQNST
ncbi:GNAT family N-acetyltransferase [Dactylosporangium sp. NPDC050688]|uniref:GNAT family N-acetyltransferase n=1 Tax=Dactylosporangium sp. NPDC050688 TaxID=3157217 RepID=UPI0033D0DFA1